MSGHLLLDTHMGLAAFWGCMSRWLVIASGVTITVEWLWLGYSNMRDTTIDSFSYYQDGPLTEFDDLCSVRCSSLSFGSTLKMSAEALRLSMRLSIPGRNSIFTRFRDWLSNLPLAVVVVISNTSRPEKSLMSTPAATIFLRKDSWTIFKAPSWPSNLHAAGRHSVMQADHGSNDIRLSIWAMCLPQQDDQHPSFYYICFTPTVQIRADEVSVRCECVKAKLI